MIVRGIERGNIFRFDYDRKNFLNRLGKLIPETHSLTASKYRTS